METLTIKTIGHIHSSVELEAKKLADALQGQISGGSATQMQVDQLTQDFVDQFEIKARYSSGTFLGFKISNASLDKFETFKRR